MSAIAGIIHFEGAPVEPGLVENMTRAMAYRGPDGISHWVKGPVAFGQCMLRTTPESLEESQPLANEDESLVLVMDGRVDNWEELRKELLGRGAILRNRSDAELVLRAYEVWGKDCLIRIYGDFALVIWNRRLQAAFCARDRLGKKPFHYHWSGGTLVFASELHPILALPWVAEEPNEGMLSEFLAAEWHSRDETLWRGIMRLAAAHCMEVGSRGPQPEPYWAPDLWATLPYTKDEDYIEHYRELMFDSVRRLSRSHQTVAIEVSGGLDSSAVFCAAERLRRASRLPAPGIEGYTLAFGDNSEANELEYARAVGDFLQLSIHEVPPTVMPLSWYEARAHATRNFAGFPNGIMHFDLTEQVSRRGSRVLLTGVGGDEWLTGTRWYYAEEFAGRRWRSLYDCFRMDASVFGVLRASRWIIGHVVFSLLPSACQEMIRKLLRKARNDHIYESDWLSSAMKENIRRRREQFRPGQSHRVRCGGQHRLLGCLSDAYSALAMEQMDDLSARLGIELRHPLHTPALVQFAFSTPERLRMRGGKHKYIHVEALRGIMPQAIFERQGKAEFSTVFRRDLNHMETRLTAISWQRTGWLDPEGLGRLIHAYRKDPFGAMWILWCIYVCDKVFYNNK